MFDQNLGEIFVVRTAGQVLDATTIASIEYAVDHLQAPLLVILGHEQCGAVTAAITHEGRAHGNIGRLLGKIQPAIDRARQLNTPPEDMVEKVTDLHLEELARQVFQESEIISQAVAEGRLRLVTGKYQMASGEVQIQHRISRDKGYPFNSKENPDRNLTSMRLVSNKIYLIIALITLVVLAAAFVLGLDVLQQDAGGNQ